MNDRNRRNGFTLIELMVVVAIIALLLAILLPSLSAARANAKSVVCLTNLHHVSLAMANYLYSSKAVYPSSYVYPYDKDGNWGMDQDEAKPFGYLHWSNFLYDSGEVSERAFQCPIFDHGGAPRTNPGMKVEDWEAGQVDQDGGPTATERMDKQAPRMSYVANAAIIPRNKFTSPLSGGPRVNVFVRESNIKYPGSTILMTEFLNNWKALGIGDSGGVISKSHRPINPFYHIGSGFDEYASSPQNPGYIYGTPSDQETYGLLPLQDVRDRSNILDHTSGVAQINAVGRSHPTPSSTYSKKYGGSANFLYCDGHGENMTVLDSVVKRQWGDRYYAITGENQVMNMSKITSGN